MKARRLAFVVLAALGTACADHAATQAVDRSTPPMVDASAGGFTIRQLTAPITADAKQWIAVNPIREGKPFTAPNGQFSLSLTDPNEEGDLERYRVTFTGGSGKPVNLIPDVTAFAFVTSDSRWIFLEPLDVVDVKTWRRYRLAERFGITAYTNPRALAADGQRLFFTQGDCAFDCPDLQDKYYEIGFPKDEGVPESQGK